MKKFLAILLLLCLFVPAACASEWLAENVTEAQVGSVGGEWVVIALKRGATPVADGFYAAYEDNVEQALIACEGRLSPVKYTEYSRVALALAALGENPADFRGWNLLEPLKDLDKVKIQGNNGPIWALIALDSNDYPGYEDARAALLDAVLSAQNEDGGYSIVTGNASDPDMTAMAITALAAHRSDERAAECIRSALACLSALEADGRLASCESCVWAMIAYASLDMREDAARLRQSVEQYAFEGAYRHDLAEDKINGMATEQAAYGVVAYQRMLDGKSRLFDMRGE